MGVSTYDVVKANAFIGPPMFTSGQIFFVGNSSTVAPNAIGGSDSNNGFSPQTPFSTIAGAISACTAGRGDIIYVLPGHAETVATAGAIALSKSGVQLIGLGTGALRPTLSFSATGSTMTIAGANTVLQNFLILTTIDAVVSNIVVSAADVKILDCEFRSGSSKDSVVTILTTASADRLEVARLTYKGAATTTATAVIALVGGDDIRIHDFDMIGQCSAGFIDCRTTAVTNLKVYAGRVRSLGTGQVAVNDAITGSTGMIGPNLQIRLSANAANITEAITGATFVVFGGGATAGLNCGSGVTVVNLANESAMTINWTASTDA